jgi:hypothetical protein
MIWPPQGIDWAYSDEFTAIAHGNSFELAPLIAASQTLQHLITDPPYSENTHSNAKTNKTQAERLTHTGRKLVTFESITVDSLRTFFASVSVERWLVATMEWRHIHDFEQQPPSGYKFLRFGVWMKSNGMPQISADRPAQGWEGIAVLHKDGTASRWNGGGKAINYYGPIEPGKHPTNKPLRLVRNFVEKFTDAGDVILDPFMGGGTTLVAAKQCGRYAIGIELEREHVETAIDRLKGTEQIYFSPGATTERRKQNEFSMQ